MNVELADRIVGLIDRLETVGDGDPEGMHVDSARLLREVLFHLERSPGVPGHRRGPRTGTMLLLGLWNMRKIRGLTIAALADKIGSSPGRVSQWENGDPVGFHSQIRLAEALTCSIDALNPQPAPKT